VTACRAGSGWRGERLQSRSITHRQAGTGPRAGACQEDEVQVTEPAYGPTGAGTVVLNLGPGVGALVLSTPPEMNGSEIEISLDGSPQARRTHSQVRERRAGGRTSYAAVYPELASGTYTIWRDHATAAGTVVVAGGAVARFDWP
jgi:hypothetical protein